MDEIVMYFRDVSLEVFEEIGKSFLENPKDFAETCSAISDELNNLGKKILVNMLENMDKVIQESPARKHEFNVERHDRKNFETIFGLINFSKTLYENKLSSQQVYLLDHLLNLDKNQRTAEDVQAKMLEEAVQTSYNKAAKACSPDPLSKQTTKNLIHNLQFPSLDRGLTKKRKVKTLYIEADEDHANLQFKVYKGDLKKNKLGRKKNGLITKLVYVHEGLRKDAPSSKKRHLIFPAYFSNCCHGGSENIKFWDEVYEYIDSTYDISAIENIYFSSDGGKWIQAGVDRIGNATYVLDEFHLNKYLLKAATKFHEDKNLVFNYLKYCIATDDKELFKQAIIDFKSKLKKGNEIADLTIVRDYIVSNWDAACRRIALKKEIFGCSAEGHVSHVLSSRMSSRPMGWSRNGADKMAQLRAYSYNKKSMLELVRYQKENIVYLDTTKYYNPEKAKSRVIIRSKDKAAKYLDTFSASTWPAKTHPMWLDRHYFTEAVGW